MNPSFFEMGPEPNGESDWTDFDERYDAPNQEFGVGIAHPPIRIITTPTASAAVVGLQAFQHGLQFQIATHWRIRPDRPDESKFHFRRFGPDMPRSSDWLPEGMRFGAEWGPRTRVTTDRPSSHDGKSVVSWLDMTGGTGTDTYWISDFWWYVRPSNEPLTFAADWLQREVPEQSVTVAAEGVAAAFGTPHPVWLKPQ